MQTMKNEQILTAFPHAKINLGLHVVRRRADGYHDLETAFYPLPLTDRLVLTLRPPGEEGCTLRQDGLPLDGASADNLVLRAYRLLRGDFPGLPPVSAHLTKRVPSGAGLGGGSSDAAHALRLLRRLCALPLDDDALERYASRLGADCAFFVRGLPALAGGVGDVFRPLPLSLRGWQAMVVKPAVSVSTAEAYARVVPREPARPLAEVLSLPVEAWRDALRNDFEESVFPLHPEIAALKERLYAAGAVYASMSGSGSAVYGLFRRSLPGSSALFPGCFVRSVPL